jgi:hypothetical protein
LALNERKVMITPDEVLGCRPTFTYAHLRRRADSLYIILPCYSQITLSSECRVMMEELGTLPHENPKAYARGLVPL